ncbi:MAG: hypothetical protein JNJ45_05270 [Chthonomonas sp.]|nr:hypothetical protein [Chthonomonas sp.]
MLGVPARLLVGAAVGTLILGIAHHRTRPVLESAVRVLTTFRGPENARVVVLSPQPALGFSRLSFDFYTKRTSVGMREDLAEAAQKEPENAFWQQGLAIAHLDANELELARRSWIRGSKCGYWKDYYPEMSANTLASAQEWFGGDWAWFQLLARDNTPGGLGLQVASARLIATAPPDQKLELQLASFRHGRLIRDFCQRLDGARKGISLIFSPESEQTKSNIRRGNWIDRFRMASALRAANREQDAKDVEQIFLTSDSWSALEDLEADGSFSEALYAVIPSVLLTALAGLLVGLAARIPLPQGKPFTHAQLGGLAVVAGLGCNALFNRDLVVTLLAASAVGLQAFRTPGAGRAAREDFPPTARLVAFLIAATIGIAVYFFLGGLPATGANLGEQLRKLAAFPVVIIAASLLVVRLASWFTRRAARDLWGEFLGAMSQSLLVLAGATFIIGLPLITVWDGSLRTEFEKIRLNEPKYAWNQVGR